jgi:uncharacterized protein (TIGR02996 family)
MGDEDAFLRAIVAAPRDAAPRLVYADGLDERYDRAGSSFASTPNRTAGPAHRAVCRSTRAAAVRALRPCDLPDRYWAIRPIRVLEGRGRMVYLCEDDFVYVAARGEEARSNISTVRFGGGWRSIDRRPAETWGNSDGCAQMLAL